MSSATGILEVFELAADGWSLGLAPSSGAIVWCAYEQSEILRRTKLQSNWRQDPFSFSCFPLAPYSNRIRDGRFEFDGKTVRIEPNAPGHAHPLHGTAWRGEWSLSSQSENAAMLDYVHHAGKAWPWSFSLAQKIVIENDALSIRLMLRNTSGEAMPAGLGFHPYFSNPQAARLRFAAEGLWLPDEAGLPETWRALGGEFDFSGGRSLKDVSIDHCFTGWRGKAQIGWRDRPFGVEITADPAMGFVVVYVSEEEDCFCFEPVSQMNDALNWANRREDTGLRVLEPGEEWPVEMRMRVFKTAEKIKWEE
ncbi:aldose 1-epimerase [Hyphococcus luteus]|uniref:aldose 1-epimerase n=1 Tax=Hyphococcus luteus TaxID=2058213 RepID=UPI0013FDF882|nr:aldose 1-epimerase [Marinicaulis flavus]